MMMAYGARSLVIRTTSNSQIYVAPHIAWHNWQVLLVITNNGIKAGLVLIKSLLMK